MEKKTTPKDTTIQPDKAFIDIKELSEIINLAVATINIHIKKGDLPSYKIGGRRLYDKDEVILWMKTHKEGK